MKTKCFKILFFITLFVVYVGLFTSADSWWVRVMSLVLLISALILKGKYYRKFIFIVTVIFVAIMTYYSLKEIPAWGARARGVCVGTDTVWGRSGGYVDSLIFTVVHDKKCIVEEVGWYNKYIEVMAADIQEVDEIDYKILSSELALAKGFEEVGWMHIDNNFPLLSNEANMRFDEGDSVYLYINPTGLSETDTVLVWNDMKGNIYIEAYDADE